MKKLVVGWCAVLLVLGVSADRYSFVGHRAAGMGGAGSATANDGSAQWQNPAAFGFFNREADPVVGPVTNAITNVVIVVTNVPVATAEAERMDILAMTGYTNTVAASIADDTNAAADVSGETASTNGAAAIQRLTNETYEVTYDVITGETIPERARVDNGGLGDRGFGWNFLGLGVGYTMTDDMPEYVTQLGKIDFDALDGIGVAPTPESVENMLLVGSALYGLGSNPDNAFYVDTTAGMNFRIGHLGFGIRFFGEVAGFVDYLDTVSMGIEQTEDEYVTAVNGAAAADGFNAAGYVFQSIGATDLDISTSVPGGAEAAAYIDYQLTQLKNDGVVNDQNIDDTVTMANLVKYGVLTDDPESFDNNKSTVTARGFGLVEVPISYGYAFNDNLSIGVTAKGMYGTVTGTKVRFTDGDAIESAMDVMEENTEASVNFGLDMGVLYRMKMLQFAAVAKNINAPEFDGFTDTIDIEDDAGNIVDTVQIDVPDYTVDPQVTLGAAFIPGKRFMLEVSYDVLEQGTLLNNYDIQRLSFGAELDLWMLALRLGAYNNLAADWQDWIATAGVGLNLYIMRLDIGGAYSIGANAEYEGTEIPEEARLYAALSFEF